MEPGKPWTRHNYAFEDERANTHCCNHGKPFAKFIQPALLRADPDKPGVIPGTNGMVSNEDVAEARMGEDVGAEAGIEYVQERLSLRVEYQTLQRLPESRHIFFTVRTYIDRSAEMISLSLRSIFLVFVSRARLVQKHRVFSQSGNSHKVGGAFHAGSLASRAHPVRRWLWRQQFVASTSSVHHCSNGLSLCRFTSGLVAPFLYTVGYIGSISVKTAGIWTSACLETVVAIFELTLKNELSAVSHRHNAWGRYKGMMHYMGVGNSSSQQAILGYLDRIAGEATLQGRVAEPWERDSLEDGTFAAETERGLRMAGGETEEQRLEKARRRQA
jgi:hypothetical protein